MCYQCIFRRKPPAVAIGPWAVIAESKVAVPHLDVHAMAAPHMILNRGQQSAVPAAVSTATLKQRHPERPEDEGLACGGCLCLLAPVRGRGQGTLDGTYAMMHNVLPYTSVIKVFTCVDAVCSVLTVDGPALGLIIE